MDILQNKTELITEKAMASKKETKLKKISSSTLMKIYNYQICNFSSGLRTASALQKLIRSSLYVRGLLQIF